METVSVVAEPTLSPADLITILDHVPAIVACWDAELRNLFANRTFAEWLGATPEQPRGKHMRDVIGREAFARRETEVRHALAGHRQQFVRVLVDSTGQERRVQIEFTPRIVDGEPRGFLALGTDITAQLATGVAMRDAGEALAVLRDREQIADEVNALVIRQLYGAVLELSAALQPGLRDPHERVQSAIHQIEAAIKDLRSLLLRPEWSPMTGQT